MISDSTDRRPGTLAWIADQVRASAASCSAGDDQVARALALLVDALLPEELPERLAGPILVDLVRGRAVDALVPYAATAIARQGIDALAERVRTQPGRRRPAGDVEHAGLARQLEDLRARGECEHGERGGDQLHPDSGKPLCALCRAGIRELA